MKNVLILAAGLFMASSTISFVNAQTTDQAPTTRFGIKGGLNLSNLYVDDVSDEKVKVGGHFGLFVKAPITSFFAIQPELLYTMKGAQVNYNAPILGYNEAKFHLNYLELPVLAVINIGAFNIHAGPYAAYLLSSKLTNTGTRTSGSRDINKDDFQAFDYGLAGGLGFDTKNFTLGVRYNYGLREVGKEGLGRLVNDSKNSVLQLYAGVSF